MRLELIFAFYFILVDIFASCDLYNLGGKHGEGYTIQVLIGTPPQNFNVVVDTGSTNLAVAGSPNPSIDKYFIRENSSTNVDLEQEVLLLYIQGYWSGDLASDVVYFPTMNDVPQVVCDIAFIKESKSIYMNGSDWQGILGLAYPALARPSSNVRPWIDALQKRYKDKTIAFSLTLCGPRIRGESQHYGNFEVLNNMKQPYPGMQSARVVREWFYEVIITSLSIGKVRVPISCRDLNTDKSIIDSGTTNIRLPKNVFEIFVKTLIPQSKRGRMLNNGKILEIDKQMNITRRYEIEEWNLPDEFWYKQKVLCWPTLQNWYMMPNISIELASEPTKYFRINIPGTSYIRQVFDQEDADGKYCYKFSVEPFETGTILGVVALEGFQVIFNRTARTVGFLKSNCGPPVSVEGPFEAEEEMDEDDMGYFSQCSHTEIVTISLLNIAAYVVCAVLFLASCMFVYLFGQWLKNKYFKYHVSGTAVSMSHASLINEDT